MERVVKSNRGGFHSPATFFQMTALSPIFEGYDCVERVSVLHDAIAWHVADWIHAIGKSGYYDDLSSLCFLRQCFVG